MKEPLHTKRAIGLEAFIFLAILIGGFAAMGDVMGGANMLNTLMNTAFQLLMDTVFYIMAVAVLAGALSALMSEFGVVALLNKILSPLMRPLYSLPGAASVGVITTFFSDNPAILPLAYDRNFARFFKRYQMPALTNIGTAFGMGFIIVTYMIGLGGALKINLGTATLIGVLGAVVGSIVSTRLMILKTSRVYGREAPAIDLTDDDPEIARNLRIVRKGNVSMRVLNSLLDGGKSGVTLGLDIIPGVLIICTIVLMLTNSASPEGYSGAAFEGVGLLPWIGEKLSFILRPLFGFTSPASIAVPITALGSAGAAMGLIPKLLQSGQASPQDVAVFTAMCMCWSGYLSTHVAMMSSLKCSELTGWALFSHSIGGLAAGISAHWLFRLVLWIQASF